jgi:hypothetical protein
MSKIVKSWEKEKEPFNASMLNRGEMMEVDNSASYNGSIIVKMYNGAFISLNSWNTWGTDCDLEGRKLLPGESVTLIQEDSLMSKKSKGVK